VTRLSPGSSPFHQLRAQTGGLYRRSSAERRLYRPGSGAALVFSCAHLHEVLDVTAGRRFVLLSFLYGEPEA
jgi:hypothetical protein